jgi:hypothetical protein
VPQAWRQLRPERFQLGFGLVSGAAAKSGDVFEMPCSNADIVLVSFANEYHGV